MIIDQKLKNHVQAIEDHPFPAIEPQPQDAEDNEDSANVSNAAPEGMPSTAPNIDKNKKKRTLKEEEYGGVWMGPNMVQTEPENINEDVSAGEDAADDAKRDDTSAPQDNLSVHFSIDEPHQHNALDNPAYSESDEHKAFKRSEVTNFCLCISYLIMTILKTAMPSYLKLNASLAMSALSRIIIPIFICYNFRQVANTTTEYLVNMKNVIIQQTRNFFPCCKIPNDTN